MSLSATEMVRLIRQDKPLKGAFTVDIAPGFFREVLGEQVLVYTHSKPESDILAFGTKEFLLVIESAQTWPIDSFRTLILAKRLFKGEIIS